MLFIQDLIKDYPSYVEIPVQWGDMDAMQHVNNIMYLRYMESSRIRFFTDVLKIGFSPEGVGAILAEIQCKYKFPLTYPDTVIAASRILPDSLDEFSVKIQQVIISTKHQRVAAEGIARIVFYDYPEKKKASIPEAVKMRLLRS
ncbi:MAG: thioesterase family protein [Spirosomataceae bacterium]